MGIRINTNIQSMVAQRNLGNVTGAQKNSLEKVASGSRINKASDDAAGLAISEKMRGQTRSIGQAMRNANDGVSMIQTAEGSMNEVGNILVRFRELSMQASSDTISDVERGFMDKEVQQLSSEVDRISKSTEFNGRKLLSGEGGPLDIQVGINNDANLDRFQYDPSKTNVSSERLGLTGFNVASKEAAQANLATVDMAIKTVSESRAELGAFQNRLQSTVSNLQVYNENLSAARSQIKDVDMASETAELAKSNILAAAGTSVLSQANSSGSMALKLIG